MTSKVPRPDNSLCGEESHIQKSIGTSRANARQATVIKALDVHNFTNANGRIQKNARPYRSHKYPACTRCHKRRSRCTIEIPGQACLLCRLSGVVCSAARTDSGTQPTRVGFVHKTSMVNADLDGYAQVLGPVLSRDTQVLESIVSDIDSNDNQQHTQTDSIPVYRSDKVSRRPSPPINWTSHDLTMQLFRQMDPYLHRLVTLYFEELHPCLPMMDEPNIWARFTHRNSLHSLFLTSLVAYTSFYWVLSPALPAEAKPDQDSVWDVAMVALRDNTQRADIFAIIASALNVAGRPSKGTVSNTGAIARNTALAHGMGLNHNCEGWNLGQLEKKVRKKLWWVLVIHDRWFNFAQGTPPYINNQHYNVPLPTLAMLIEGREISPKHVRAAECFIHLCRLTEIVGDVLPVVYHVRSGNDRFAKQQISHAEEQLASWLSHKPEWMRFETFGNRPVAPGFANLQLSYLAVRMLLRRIVWHENTIQSKVTYPPGLLECLQAAEAVTEFLLSLTGHDLAGFWLPYHAQHFTSATTLLLRCALQTDDQQLRHRAMSSAHRLVDCLRAFYEQHQWDLAESVLPQTEAILSKIDQALPKLAIRPVLPPGLSQASRLIEPEPGLGFHATAESNIDHGVLDFQHAESLESLFPELFAEFADNAFFDWQPDSEI